MTGTPFVTLEDGDLARRQDGRARRLIALDHLREGTRATRTACVRGRTRSSSAPGRSSPTTRRSRPAIRICPTPGRRSASWWTAPAVCRPTARSFDGSAPTLVATTVGGERARRPRAAAGVEVAVCAADGTGGVCAGGPARAAREARRARCVLEGGATLAWSFLRDGAVDRIVQYVAPRLIGGAAAPGAVMGEGFAPIGGGAGADVRASRPCRSRPPKVEADVHRDR